MPKKTKPAYLLHRATGQARCRINGKDHYLGEFGSPESREKYEALVSEWFARNGDTTRHTITVDDLVLLYMEHVRQHYRKNGRPTSEVTNIRIALKYVVAEFGTTRAKDFGPRALKAARQAMIDAGCVRTSINRMAARIRGMFKWAVAEELVPPETLVAIQSLAGLRYGRSNAKEAQPVKPVPQAFIDAVEPHVSRQVWSMIQLQRLTGARPGEIVAMRGCDLNTKGAIWEYVPESHKTQHHGKRRMIFLGPQAQEVLKPFLKMDLAAHLFSPAESREAHLEQRRAHRKTPLTPSQLARTRKPNPSKTPGDCYTVVSYGRAIRNACQRADREAHKESPDVAADVVLILNWHPHQLRHNAATEVRRQFGIETARAVLGHSSIATSELYAEFDDHKAREAIARIG
jgi:integrase